MKQKKLSDQVIVITGATSGIGLATARMAAKRHAKVVLSSRNEAELRTITDEIRQNGGQAIYVVADISDPEQVQEIAETAIREFGGFDTWVNNAGQAIYGKLIDTPLHEKKRLFDVNFWGVVYGCRTAFSHLREKGGTIINLGSILSTRAIPLQGVYTASKHAVKGYTDTLRMEIEKDHIPVSVTLVQPTSVATPYPEHAQNHMKESATLPPVIYAPEVVAQTILFCAEHPRRDIFVGGSAKLYALMEALIPRLTDLLMEKFLFQMQKSNKSKPGEEQSGLFHAPEHEGKMRGDYSGHVARSSIYTTLALRPVLSAFALGGLGALLLTLRNKGQSRISRGTAGENVILDQTRALEKQQRKAA